MTESIEEYWKDIRPLKPVQKDAFKKMAEDGYHLQPRVGPPREPTLDQGEFEFMLHGIKYRGLITELKREMDESYIHGVGRGVIGRASPRERITITAIAIPMVAPDTIEMNLGFGDIHVDGGGNTHIRHDPTQESSRRLPWG